MTSKRVDRKYLLPEVVVQEALSENAELWTPEVVDGFEKQHYETDYFDTPSLDLFHAARGQRASRSKVRVRHYLDTDSHFVEVKSRNPRGEIVKTRQAWTGSLDGARAFLDDALGKESSLIPQLKLTARTGYQRAALVLHSGGRVTVDRKLRLGDQGSLTHLLFYEGSELVIVETKSPDQSPTEVDRYLWDRHYRPLSLSKYALAIASFRPDLPLNRWARVAEYLEPITT